MKKGKIILSVALALVMALSLLPKAFEAAQAVPVEYTVTFDRNGKGTENVEKKVKIGEYAEWIEMKDENYAFGGWYKEPECNNLFLFDQNPITDNITLYAKWVNSFPIRLLFNSDHGTATADKTSAFWGDTVNVTVTPKEGYIFNEISCGNGVKVDYIGSNTSYTIPKGIRYGNEENTLVIDVDFAKESEMTKYPVRVQMATMDAAGKMVPEEQRNAGGTATVNFETAGIGNYLIVTPKANKGYKFEKAYFGNGADNWKEFTETT